MMRKPACPIITLEEHYSDDEMASHFPAGGASRDSHMMDRLRDLGERRIREMDEAGVDIQVISHNAPSGQALPPEIAVEVCRKVNDRLHEGVLAHPTRFAAFAALPTADSAGAADELERTVTKLGFKGAMVYGLPGGDFLDHKRYWPIFERAVKLDVPIYLHPSTVKPAVMGAYYQDYAKDFPMFARPAWGFAVETGTLAIRLVLSGLFEAYPRLKIMMGHLGESVPFQVWRVDQALSRPGQKSMNFREIFCNNFYVTTSGFFSTAALMCCIMEMGAEHVMFSVDWPAVDNQPGTQWLETLPLSNADKIKIAGGNAKRLLRL
jgi:predicted TIM-barrel fold metal-dependent hydrolase